MNEEVREVIEIIKANQESGHKYITGGVIGLMLNINGTYVRRIVDHQRNTKSLWKDGYISATKKGYFLTKDETTIKMHLESLSLRGQKIIDTTNNAEKNLAYFSIIW